MPYKFFLCPDGNKTQICDCLTKCRMGDRCLSLPTLRLIGEQRAWSGKPSTTQLLKCSREAYIEIMYDDLEMDPQDAMFRILGSKAHLSLEKYTPSELAEERLEDTESSGAFDLYDPESRTLYDYKTWGSYKVQQALGLKVKEVETGEVYKSGVNKGKAKTKKVIEKGEPDMFDVEMQLNDYRIKLEAAGFPVENMIVESIVRDGSTFIAASRGITQNAYLIPVRRLNDEEVKTYFRAKSELLLTAIEKKIMPGIGSAEERWNNRKCESYCASCKHCDYGLKVKDAKIKNESRGA